MEAPAFSSILRRGLEKNRNEALAQAPLTYGSDAVVGTDFDLKKTAGCEWCWGPIEAAKKPTPGKRAKTSGKAAKAPRATKAAEEKSPPPRNRRLASALTFWRPLSAARYRRRRISRPTPTFTTTTASNSLARACASAIPRLEGDAREGGLARPSRLSKAVDNGGLRYGAVQGALRPPLPTATQSAFTTRPSFSAFAGPKSALA